jgi:EAL domain-containing protein (putative c-di-GMP-specific phosphodiesterase class I)
VKQRKNTWFWRRIQLQGQVVLIWPEDSNNISPSETIPVHHTTGLHIPAGSTVCHKTENVEVHSSDMLRG